MDPQKQERISIRAYRIWEEAGRPDGRESEHWSQAQTEIEAEDNDTGTLPPGERAEPSAPELRKEAKRNTAKPRSTSTPAPPASKPAAEAKTSRRPRKPG